MTDFSNLTLAQRLENDELRIRSIEARLEEVFGDCSWDDADNSPEDDPVFRAAASAADRLLRTWSRQKDSTSETKGDLPSEKTARLLGICRRFGFVPQYGIFPEYPMTVGRIVFSRDGALAASLNRRGDPTVISVGSMMPLFTISSGGPGARCSFSPDSVLIAVADLDDVSVWDIETMERTVLLSNCEGEPSEPSWSDDGNSVSFCCGGRTYAYRMDREEPEQTAGFRNSGSDGSADGSDYRVSALSADGGLLFCGGKSIAVIDLASGAKAYATGTVVKNMELSPDARAIWYDGRFWIFDTYRNFTVGPDGAAEEIRLPEMLMKRPSERRPILFLGIGTDIAGRGIWQICGYVGNGMLSLVNERVPENGSGTVILTPGRMSLDDLIIRPAKNSSVAADAGSYSDWISADKVLSVCGPRMIACRPTGNRERPWRLTYMRLASDGLKAVRELLPSAPGSTSVHPGIGSEYAAVGCFGKDDTQPGAFVCVRMIDRETGTLSRRGAGEGRRNALYAPDGLAFVRSPGARAGTVDSGSAMVSEDGTHIFLRLSEKGTGETVWDCSSRIVCIDLADGKVYPKDGTAVRGTLAGRNGPDGVLVRDGDRMIAVDGKMRIVSEKESTDDGAERQAREEAERWSEGFYDTGPFFVWVCEGKE